MNFSYHSRRLLTLALVLAPSFSYPTPDKSATLKAGGNRNGLFFFFNKISIKKGGKKVLSDSKQMLITFKEKGFFE